MSGATDTPPAQCVKTWASDFRGGPPGRSCARSLLQWDAYRITMQARIGRQQAPSAVTSPCSTYRAGWNNCLRRREAELDTDGSLDSAEVVE
jgi:hypothetical protein